MAARSVISDAAVERRRYWVTEIVRISGEFGPDVERAARELGEEEAVPGEVAVVDHLRLCGAIPESYGHDSSEEKLYSKYTDAVIAAAFARMGLRSLVLTERADAADVEAFAPEYTLVADAKAFRLSRTAKNQKDFKVQAMDTWRRDKRYAVVVSPLYQLPSRSSQIYHQAIARDVCLLSYCHLAVLVRLAVEQSPGRSREILGDVLGCVAALHPDKTAAEYWRAVNSALLGGGDVLHELWRTEKVANIEAIELAKEEALDYLAGQRTAIMALSHDEALRQLIAARNIGGRERTIRSVADNGLMSI